MGLAMIRDGFNTGYAIKQRLDGVASFFWSASYGQIYPELRRLEALGLITGREVQVSGRLCRGYALTAAATDQLQRWLARLARPSLRLRDEALLRMMVVDWEDHELETSARRRAPMCRLPVHTFTRPGDEQRPPRRVRAAD